MKPYFITCDVKSVRAVGKDRLNNPVNLVHCVELVKSRYNWYYNEKGLPSIVFNGTNVEWVYESEEERDNQFDRIIIMSR